MGLRFRLDWFEAFFETLPVVGLRWVSVGWFVFPAASPRLPVVGFPSEVSVSEATSLFVRLLSSRLAFL